MKKNQLILQISTNLKFNLVLSFLMFVFSQNIVKAQRWETLGTEVFSGGILKLDQNGTPWVAYRISGNVLGVKKYINSSWVTVGSPIVNSQVNQPEFNPIVFDFKFDKQGNPYILTLVSDGVSFAYVYKFDGTDWPLVGGNRFFTFGYKDAKLAFDKNNTVYVGGTTGDGGIGQNSAYDYFRFENGIWSGFSTLGDNNQPLMGRLFDFEIDDIGSIYYSFKFGGFNEVSKIQNGVWVKLGNAGSIYTEKSKIFINNNDIYVSSYDSYNSYFKKFSNTSWVDAAPQIPTSFNGTSFGMDKSGNLYNSGYQSLPSPYGYKVNKFDGSKWNTLCPQFPKQPPLTNLNSVSFIEIDDNSNVYMLADGLAYKYSFGILPSTPTIQTNQLEFCANAISPVPISIIGNLNDAKEWVLYSGGCGSTFVGRTTGNSITINPSQTATYFVRGEGICSLVGSCSNPITIKINNVPNQPSFIAGPNTVCAGTTAQYFTSAPVGSTGLTWTVPEDATILSGQGTNTIQVRWGTKSGNIEVVANNNCGSSIAQRLNITVNNVPVVSSPIFGASSVCINTNSVFSILNSVGATSYTWSVPSDAVILSGQNTNSINVRWGQSDGVVSVTANNACGASAPTTLQVLKNQIPSSPAAISGPSAPCPSTQVNYSIPEVSGATNYIWTLPSGASIVSGQNTNSISVLVGNSNGVLSVAASNVCGASPLVNLPINLKTNTQITTQPLDRSICSNESTTLAVGATGTNLTYRWSNGVQTPTISISQAGSYSVVVTGDCGAVTSRTAIVSITPNTSITQQPQSTSVCIGNQANLSVLANGSNLSYLWSNGATTRTISVTQGGSYRVQVSGTCGVVQSNEANVTISPNTQILNDPDCNYVLFCSDKQATLSVPVIGSNLTYLWSNGATTPVLTTNQTGCYSVLVTGQCGPAVRSKNITAIAQPVTILPANYQNIQGLVLDPNACYKVASNPPVTTAITGPTQVCARQNVPNQIYNAPTNIVQGATYNWWVNGVASVQSVPGHPEQASITFSEWYTSGSVKLGVNLPSSPWYVEYSLNVNSSPCNGRVSQEESDSPFATIFPNPYENYSTISLLGSVNDQFSVKVVDSKGVVLASYDNLVGNSQLEIGKNLAAGMYTINISNNGTIKSYKLVRLP